MLKALPPDRARNSLYVVTEFIEGQTLSQWMIDNPRPDLDVVRDIVGQIAKGLRAFHRMEMLHQDLRPANVMVDRTGTARIIDFGAVRVAGIAEGRPMTDDGAILGTHQFTAPEYFLGEPGTTRSDLFSLGVIAYQMLTGSLPYGTQVAQAQTKSRQTKLRYVSALTHNATVPVWIDGALARAVAIDPRQRYDALSEFQHDLLNPRAEFLRSSAPPLLERNPLLF